MKATQYSEEEQLVQPIDEHKLAIASEKPEKIDSPRQAYYIVDYKTLVKPPSLHCSFLWCGHWQHGFFNSLIGKNKDSAIAFF